MKVSRIGNCESHDLLCLHRHRHDDRGGVVVPFDQLDLGERLAAGGMNGEVADLLAAQVEGELGAGHVDAADVVGEVLAVLERVVLGLAVGVVQPDDQR